jgi:hypothetical protein
MLKQSPGFMTLESKSFPLVAVCATESSFVHATVLIYAYLCRWRIVARIALYRCTLEYGDTHSIGRYSRILVLRCSIRARLLFKQCGISSSPCFPDALAAGVIDAGIGLGNCQLIELENMLNNDGGAGFLKFDESLGIHCCFCSVLYIANERFLNERPEQARGFMRALGELRTSHFKNLIKRLKSSATLFQG